MEMLSELLDSPDTFRGGPDGSGKFGHSGLVPPLICRSLSGYLSILYCTFTGIYTSQILSLMMATKYDHL